MNGNILQLNELIDSIFDFLNTPKRQTFHIGSMTGCQSFKITIDCILSKSEFKDICVIEGCQDYIGMVKKSILNNHFYYADLITETTIPDCEDDSFRQGYLIWNPIKLKYKYHVDISLIGKFDYLIINDAHLIPIDILKFIENNFQGKCFILFDPFDVNGEFFIGHPTIIDSLSKSSAITAFARSMYNVSTRSIDKSVPCSVKEGKLLKRSIGKNDGNQYITDNKSLAVEMWDKQMHTAFRKGQRLLVVDPRIKRLTDNAGRIYTITKNTLLVIDSVPNTSKLLRLKVWNTKFVFESMVSYGKKQNIGVIDVRPANIILTDEVRYHKFPHTVLVSDNMLNPRIRYSILKNTQNLVVAT